MRLNLRQENALDAVAARASRAGPGGLRMRLVIAGGWFPSLGDQGPRHDDEPRWTPDEHFLGKRLDT